MTDADVLDLLCHSSTPLTARAIGSRLGVPLDALYCSLVRLYSEGLARIIINRDSSVPRLWSAA